MNERVGYGVLVSLVAGALSFAAACSWRGMLTQPHRYLLPALVAAGLVALTGALGRRLRLHWYAVLALQLVVVLVWLHHRQTPRGTLGGWLPTPHGVAVIIDQVRDGASDVNIYAAPLSAQFTHAPLYLVVCAAVLALLVDLVACGFRQPAWAGLPVLVAVTIPISVLDGGLPAPVYLATGLLFALLLAVSEGGRALAWGHGTERSATTDDADLLRRAAALGARALAIGAVATASALVLSLAVPVGDGFFRTSDDSGPGDGSASGTVSLRSPMVDLRRDLGRNDHLPLLEASTDAADPSYLRLTVLDDFVDGAWVPSPRELAATNAADGRLPDPPGLRTSQDGTGSTWRLRTTRAFRTSWLPTPVPTRSISVASGDWRYDPALLDIASVEDPPPTQVSYQLTAFAPRFTAAQLRRSGEPPTGLLDAMTALPPLPAVVSGLAAHVTAAGRSEYEKAVLLQNWFRVEGGFTYSLASAPGSGLGQLAAFLTTDKVGYCEQFAAAMALMARSLHIPARVVVGFLSPTRQVSGSYLYTSDDLHAWPELYFADAGWVRFEPTPSSRTGTAPAWSRGAIGPRPGSGPSSTTPPTKAPLPASKPAVTTEDETSAGGSRVLAVGALVAASVLLLLLVLGAPRMIRARQRRQRLSGTADPRHDVEGLWAELGATADDLAVRRPRGRSPRVEADALAQAVRRGAGTLAPGDLDTDLDALDHLVRLVERARYADRFDLEVGDRQAALRAVAQWSRLLRRTVTPRQLRRAWLLPRSAHGRRGTTTDQDASADVMRVQ